MGKKLYVGNMPYQTTESEVRDLFGEHGEIASLDWLTDRDTGAFRGFCFVEMGTDDEARAAMQALDGQDFNGRNLRVSEARPRSNNQDRGGGRPRRDQQRQQRNGGGRRW